MRIENKRWLGFIAALSCLSGLFANSPISQVGHSGEVRRLPGFIRLTWDNVTLPGNRPDMGFLGFNYLMDLNAWMYVGPGIYSAVTGGKGGLFTLGLDAGIQHQIYKRLYFNVGAFAGGGGREANIVGGGLMLRPYGGLFFDFTTLQLGLDYSYVTFPDNGSIHSSQLAVQLNIPANISYSPGNSVSGFIQDLKDVITIPDGNIGFARNYFALLEQNYFQRKGSKGDGGKVNDGTVKLLGFEAGHYFTAHWFALLKASGAFAGSHHGYMDVLWGLGYSQHLTKRLEAVAQLNVGSGGGGDLSTGGGVEINPSAGLRLFITRSLALQLSGGYMAAPDGDLRAAVLAVKLNYFMNWAKISDKPSDDNASPPYFYRHWRVRLLNTSYFQPQRSHRHDRSNVNFIVLQPDLFVSNYFYVTGQAAFAYHGDQSGGLASGLLGVGFESPTWKHLSLYAELMAGAEGGGGLALGSGAIVQPGAGIQLKLNNYLGAQVGGYWVKSIKNRLSAPVLTAGLTLRFASLNSRV